VPGINVIFDEAHREAWTIDPQLAAEMQPAHPGDASYARAAELLTGHGFQVGQNAALALERGVLVSCDLLVIAHPSEDQWERTTGVGSPLLSKREIDAIVAYVEGGGGLLVLGETEQDKYGNNLNTLLDRFGLRLRNDTVQDYEHCDGAPSWVSSPKAGADVAVTRWPASTRPASTARPRSRAATERACSRARMRVPPSPVSR
jgi:hypothetical protein